MTPNKVNRLKRLCFGICLMITLSSDGAVLPFNSATNGLGSNWAVVFQDNFSGTNLNPTNWVPYWFSNGTTNPGSGTRGYASNVVVNGQLNLIMRNTTNGGCYELRGSSLLEKQLRPKFVVLGVCVFIA